MDTSTFQTTSHNKLINIKNENIITVETPFFLCFFPDYIRNFKHIKENFCYLYECNQQLNKYLCNSFDLFNKKSL